MQKKTESYLLRCHSLYVSELEVTENILNLVGRVYVHLFMRMEKDPSEISRKDEIWQSEHGLITIAGGKLTGYRKMAEKIVDLLVNS